MPRLADLHGVKLHRRRDMCGDRDLSRSIYMLRDDDLSGLLYLSGYGDLSRLRYLRRYDDLSGNTDLSG